MGCDIHLFIEYKTKENKNWWNFGKKINPGRHYEIFAGLANVRNYDGCITPISKPRGLPKDIGWVTKDENTYWIIDSLEDMEEPRSVLKETALNWINSGSSTYEGEYRVTDPDWHSHSWATREELEKVLNECTYPPDTEWLVVLEVLKVFEKLEHETRIVFWFDN